MTIAGWLVPSLMMHQLWDDVRSKRSSRCNCCRIGTPFTLTRFIIGTPILPGFPILPPFSLLHLQNSTTVSQNSLSLKNSSIFFFFGFKFSGTKLNPVSKIESFRHPIRSCHVFFPKKLKLCVLWNWSWEQVCEIYPPPKKKKAILCVIVRHYLYFYFLVIVVQLCRIIIYAR